MHLQAPTAFFRKHREYLRGPSCFEDSHCRATRCQMSVEIVVPTNCQEAGTPPGEVHERVTRIGEWLGNPREWNEETQLLCFFFRGVFIRAKKFCLDIFFVGSKLLDHQFFKLS